MHSDGSPHRVPHKHGGRRLASGPAACRLPCPLLFPYLGLLSGWGCLGGVAACTAAVTAAVHAVAAAKHGMPDGHYVGCQRGGCQVSFVISRAEAVTAKVGSHYSVPAAWRRWEAAVGEAEPCPGDARLRAPAKVAQHVRVVCVCVCVCVCAVASGRSNRRQSCSVIQAVSRGCPPQCTRRKAVPAPASPVLQSLGDECPGQAGVAAAMQAKQHWPTVACSQG